MAAEMPGLISCFELFYRDLRSQFPIIQTSRSFIEAALQVGQNSWMRQERRYEDHMAKEGREKAKDLKSQEGLDAFPCNVPEFEIIIGQTWSCRHVPIPRVPFFSPPFAAP